MRKTQKREVKVKAGTRHTLNVIVTNKRNVKVYKAKASV